MIISKSNITSASTMSLDVGTISSGVLANLQDSDFSKIIVSTTGLEFSFASVGSAQYVALHGLKIPIGSLVTIAATGFSKAYTTTNNVKNLVFYNETPSTFGDLTITIVGAGTKTISYVSAGLATNISWGTSSGQSLHYLGMNNVERVTSDNRGKPQTFIEHEKHD